VGLARSAGVAVLRGGQLVDAAMPHPSREVNDIAEDAQGGIWIARGGRSTSTLARFAAGNWREYGAPDGLPPGPVWQILFTRDGTQWVVLNDQLAWRPAGRALCSHRHCGVAPRGAGAGCARAPVAGAGQRHPAGDVERARARLGDARRRPQRTRAARAC
jgi:hypothetical protein